MTGDVRFTQLPVSGFRFKVGKNSKDDFKTQYAQVIKSATQRCRHKHFSRPNKNNPDCAQSNL
ncbi:MAG: hypothetical protein BGN92_03185 [Sphingobacteriales bacterium 41-5]|nr:MAG: hypothetical protein BGN92_03185 [Sphingobacteriales bacterium 41-5]